MKGSKLRFRLCGRVVGFRPQLEPVYMSPEVRSLGINVHYVNVITTRLEEPLLSVYIDCKDNRSMQRIELS